MKPLFLLSLDALGYVDEPVYAHLPFFSKMIQRGTWVRRLQSVYPTLTYPIHSSVVSGRYPLSHWVDNNLKLQPERQKMDWFWDQTDFKGDSLFKAAKRKGLTTAAFSWPVTGYAEIDYNFPEVWAFDEDLQTTLEKKGTPSFVKELTEAFGRYENQESRGDKDDYLFQAALHTFKKYRPDITLMHIIDVDSTKHHFGANHWNTQRSIIDLDKRLDAFFTEIGKLVDLDEVNIMLISDHSQIDTGYGIRLNKMLADMGLLEAKEDGTSDSWQAYFLTCGGSCALYLKDEADQDLVQKIRSEIESLNLEGIDRIFDKEEIVDMGASKEAVIWVEAKEGYAFEASATGQVFSKHPFLGSIGNHGFLPSKEKNFAIGLFAGPDFKENQVIEFGELIQIAPTVDAIYGLGIEDMEKEPIQIALK